jgi:hypothetical protein
MTIGSCFNAIRDATARTASTVYGYVGGAGKSALGACGVVAGKIGAIAARLIPSFISSTVQAYPKSFCTLGGLALGAGVTTIANRFFSSKDNNGSV